MNIATKKFLIVVVFSIVILTAGVIYFAFSSYNRYRVLQPLEYSHKAHVESAGMKCTDCHFYVDKMASASIPSLEVCQTCHNDEPVSTSPEEVKLLSYVKEGKEIPWRQVYEVPDHVYFSHRRHVIDGELDCSECHGNMAELTKSVSYQAIPMTMKNCLDCHKQRKVTTDCLACHR
ncbi:MAG: cytochrome c3 family protein [Ignavibacteriae bacterium]|nr:cytochrome c3 family protein [Ignavibacteriota bacterium]